MFEIFVEKHFSASHRLRDYNGNCANWHGHNWLVKAFVLTEDVDELGLAVDFRQVKAVLNEVLDYYDHSCLNKLPEFSKKNPTCEVIAQTIYRSLAKRLNDNRIKVSKVQISETPTTGVTYYE